MLDQIHSFRDIGIVGSAFAALALSCLFTWRFPPRKTIINGKSTSGVETSQILSFLEVDLPLQHPTSKA